MKCLICKEIIPDNHCCMNMKVGDKFFSIHMGCEQELNNLKITILNILVDWDGIWHKYEALLEALKIEYALTPTRKEAREALQFLVKIGEVRYGPLVNGDYIPCGAGYTWVHGAGVC